MREIVYSFSTLGAYHTTDNTSFADDSKLRIIVEPHDFSISIGGEELRRSSFAGVSCVVSYDGEAVFYDIEESVIGRAEKTVKTYNRVRVEWKNGCISVQFGHVESVDYYPNCDGEHDRWGEKWITEHTVTLSVPDNTVTAD